MSERVVNPPQATSIVCDWPHRAPMHPSEIKALADRVARYYVPTYDVEAELREAEAKFLAWQQRKVAS